MKLKAIPKTYFAKYIYVLKSILAGNPPVRWFEVPHGSVIFIYLIYIFNIRFHVQICVTACTHAHTHTHVVSRHVVLV